MKRLLVAIAKLYGMTEEQSKSMNYDNLEVMVNNDFASAHNSYINCIVVNHMDYELYLELFFMIHEHEKEMFSDFPNDLSCKFAYSIVKYILKQKEKLVRKFFELKPIGNYCELVRTAIDEKCNDQNMVRENDNCDCRYKGMPKVEINRILQIPFDMRSVIPAICGHSFFKYFYGCKVNVLNRYLGRQTVFFC